MALWFVFSGFNMLLYRPHTITSFLLNEPNDARFLCFKGRPWTLKNSLNIRSDFDWKSSFYFMFSWSIAVGPSEYFQYLPMK